MGIQHEIQRLTGLIVEQPLPGEAGTTTIQMAKRLRLSSCSIFSDSTGLFIKLIKNFQIILRVLSVCNIESIGTNPDCFWITRRNA